MTLTVSSCASSSSSSSCSSSSSTPACSSSSSPRLGCEDTSLALEDLTSLPFSLPVSSVVELSRCLVVGGTVAAPRVAGAEVPPDAVRDVVAEGRVEGGASEGLEVLKAVDVEGEATAEVRRPAVVVGGNILCRGLVVAEGAGFLPAGGVLVRDVDVLDTPLLPTCFVGLFVGDRIPLSPPLAPAVGLPGSTLSRLPGRPARLCLLTPFVPLPASFAAVLPFPAAVVALTTLFTPLCRRNMPYPGSHWK